MSRLLRLYPTAWRARYEAEFLHLLAERPPTLRDRLDIARGAIDARLHPQVVGSSESAQWARRLPRLAFVVGGLLWAATGLVWAQTDVDWSLRAGGPSGIYRLAHLLFAPAAILWMVGLVGLRRELGARSRAVTAGQVTALVGLVLIAGINVLTSWFGAVLDISWWWSPWLVVVPGGLVLAVGLLTLGVALAATDPAPLVGLPLALLGLFLFALFWASGSGDRPPGFLLLWSGFGVAWMLLALAPSAGRGTVRSAERTTAP